MAGVCVLIVDDDADMRMLVRVRTQLHTTVDIVGEATDAQSGVEMWRQHHPDIVVMDYRMPGESGLDAAGQILAEDPSQTIILFSAHLSDATVDAAHALGIHDILAKDELHRLTDLISARG